MTESESNWLPMTLTCKALGWHLMSLCNTNVPNLAYTAKESDLFVSSSVTFCFSSAWECGSVVGFHQTDGTLINMSSISTLSLICESSTLLETHALPESNGLPLLWLNRGFLDVTACVGREGAELLLFPSVERHSGLFMCQISGNMQKIC